MSSNYSSTCSKSYYPLCSLKCRACSGWCPRSARRFTDGASERSRPLWPGMNAALTVSGGKHARVMKRVRVGQERPWQRSGCP